MYRGWGGGRKRGRRNKHFDCLLRKAQTVSAAPESSKLQGCLACFKFHDAQCRRTRGRPPV